MFAELPLWSVFALFALAGVVILICGLQMTDLADRIADRTGFGEAVVGGILLGASTSLSGAIVSVTAALDDRASLAFSNGIGGIAAQTAFLALADLIYRRANLEHASAELANLFQCSLLILMLSVPLVAFTAPEIAIWSVHPASIVLVGLYIVGVRATVQVRENPMWRPVRTRETREDAPEDEEDAAKSPTTLLVRFALLMVILSVAGWTIARCAGVITDEIGISATTVGALMTAVVTSMPELVTTITAVRRGALQLAVGGIIGGNTFDSLFLTLSDIGYRDGSIYHAVGPQDFFWLAVGLSMTAVLLLGLILRERRGPVGIGIESAGILTIYGGAILIQAAM
ncbi:MAG: sodium:calcium antiporter [Geminicoccaceae bacterium]